VGGKDGFWRWCGVPVLVSLCAFPGLNAIWNHPYLGNVLGPCVPYSITVYLVGGSGLALAFLWAAARAGRLSRNDLGLDRADWTAPRRLLGLAVIVAVTYGMFATIGPGPSPAGADGAPAAAAPTGGEFCFWSSVLLLASQAELLVFVGVCFCLTETWLRHRGWGRPLAVVTAGTLACVTFGLYHYTHEPRWHAYSFGLMGEMAFILLFFRATRNFFLTLVLHNALAAIGFTSEAHYSAEPVPMQYFADPWPLALNLTSFLVPFVLLHLLEWRGWPPAEEQAPPAA